MNTSLQGKSVLVTEAVRNFGKATAMAFAKEGANLLLATADDSGLLEQIASEARELGVKVVTESLDISDEAQVQAMVQNGLTEFGRLDVLVNNALYPLQERSFEEIDFGQWQRKIQLEVTGALLVCRSVLPGMVQQQWGRVINFSGLAAFQGLDAPSSATQLGIVGLTRGIAREYGKDNITANCIGPGGIEGSQSEGVTPEPPGSNDPVRRWGRPEEVAFLAVCLASEDAGYLTGQCLLANGGKYFL